MFKYLLQEILAKELYNLFTIEKMFNYNYKILNQDFSIMNLLC